MENTKVKLILVISILALGLGLVGCGKQPAVNQNVDVNANINTDEVNTTGWKTYRNSKCKFEFKYPPQLVISGGGQSCESVLTLKDSQGFGKLSISNLPRGFEDWSEDEFKERFIPIKNDYYILNYSLNKLIVKEIIKSFIFFE